MSSGSEAKQASSLGLHIEEVPGSEPQAPGSRLPGGLGKRGGKSFAAVDKGASGEWEVMFLED
jgi:hypothetical protein